ncbi:hypothetical protein ACFL7D_09125, partial [candidate division KSB1 bacterium]
VLEITEEYNFDANTLGKLVQIFAENDDFETAEKIANMGEKREYVLMEFISRILPNQENMDLENKFDLIDKVLDQFGYSSIDFAEMYIGDLIFAAHSQKIFTGNSTDEELLINKAYDLYREVESKGVGRITRSFFVSAKSLITGNVYASEMVLNSLFHFDLDRYDKSYLAEYFIKTGDYDRAYEMIKDMDHDTKENKTRRDFVYSITRTGQTLDEQMQSKLKEMLKELAKTAI